MDETTSTMSERRSDSDGHPRLSPLSIGIIMVAAVTGGVLGAWRGTCYPSWSETSTWHRIDNAYIGAMSGLLLAGILQHQPSAVAGAACAVTIGLWGLLVEVPIAILFGVVLPQSVITLARTGLGVVAANFGLSWIVRQPSELVRSKPLGVDDNAHTDSPNTE